RLTRLSIQWARAARPYALSLHDALPISAVGDQALLRAGAGAQRGRPRQHPLLETVLLLVEQGLEDAGPGAEAAEDGALAQPGALGQGVHRHLPRPVLGYHGAGGRQQVLAVARRVRALAAWLAEGYDGRVHAINLPGESKRGEVRLACERRGVRSTRARPCPAVCGSAYLRPK